MQIENPKHFLHSQPQWIKKNKQHSSKLILDLEYQSTIEPIWTNHIQNFPKKKVNASKKGVKLKQKNWNWRWIETDLIDEMKSRHGNEIKGRMKKGLR